MYREPATREEKKAVRLLAQRVAVYTIAVSTVLAVATIVGGVTFYALRPKAKDAEAYCTDHLVSRYDSARECLYDGQRIEGLSAEVAVCRCPATALPTADVKP